MKDLILIQTGQNREKVKKHLEHSKLLSKEEINKILDSKRPKYILRNVEHTEEVNILYNNLRYSGASVNLIKSLPLENYHTKI